MTRVDQLPENIVQEKLKQINAFIDSYKLRQLTAGKNMVINFTVTGNTWDINDTVPDFYNGLWRITFVPSTTVSPYTEIQVNYEIPDFAPGIPSGFIDVYPDPATIQTPGSVSYLMEFVNFNGAGANPIKAKFAFKSADTGTIQITRLPDF